VLIEVRVPFDPGRNLGGAYNEAMRTVQDWVLFLDDDVFLRTQPAWYDIAVHAIQKAPNAGLLTCVTNRIGCPQQRCVDAPKGDDMAEHIEFARRRFAMFGYTVNELPHAKPSGMLMLTSKRAWERCGGFQEGFLGVDNAYAQAIRNAGMKVYLMEGLYVYHAYKREWKKA
jgi:GT2 family glycosyltransferase